jgi:hypothetical protein
MNAAMKSSERVGRYGRFDGSIPGPDLPREGSRAGGKIQLVHAIVDDPNTTLDPGAKTVGRRKQRAAVNCKTDLLEEEHKLGSISYPGYKTACRYQDIMEVSSGQHGGGISMEPSSGVGDRDMTMVRKLDRAARAVAWDDAARRAVGRDAWLLLRAVLGDKQTFTQIAQQSGYKSWRGPKKIRGEFHEAVEGLSIHIEKYGEPY